MYLYFNKQGKLTTAIPHGEPVRQGNMLNLYVCLDKDFFSSKNYNPEDWIMQVETKLADGEPGQLLIASAENGPTLFKFNKLIDSEVVYDLIPGKIYYRYEFKIDYEYSTKVAGVMETQISICSLDQAINYFGVAEIFVERTFNFSDSIKDEEELSYDIFKSQLELIEQQIQNLYSSPRRIFKVQRVKPLTNEEVLKLTGPNGDLPIYIISGEYLELTPDTIPNNSFVYKSLSNFTIGETTFENNKYYYYDTEWNEFENFEDVIGCGYLLKENGEYEVIFYGKNHLWTDLEARVNTVIDERTAELVVFYDYTKQEDENE